MLTGRRNGQQATEPEKSKVHATDKCGKAVQQAVTEALAQGSTENRDATTPAGRVTYGFTHTACPKKKAKNQYGTSLSEQPEKVTCLACKERFRVAKDAVAFHVGAAVQRFYYNATGKYYLQQ